MEEEQIKNSDSRISRALSQKLFLIETIPTDLPHLKKFIVMGTTGNVYTVSISESSKCSCPDFLKIEKGCKHVFFILLKVMQLPTHDRITFSKDELDSMFLNIPPITSSLILNDSLRKIYKERIFGINANENLVEKKSIDDICPICLDPLESSSALEFCKFGCGKQIHSICFKMWAKKNQAICVFCRKKWEVVSSDPEYVNLTGKKRGRPRKNVCEAASFREKIKKRKREEVEEDEEEEEYEVEKEGLDEDEEEEEEEEEYRKEGREAAKEEGEEVREEEDEEEEDEEEEEERLIYEEMKRVGSSIFPRGEGEKTEGREGMEEEKQEEKKHKKKKHKHRKDKEKKKKNRKDKVEDGIEKEVGLKKRENEGDVKNEEGDVDVERKKKKKEKKHKKHKKEKREKKEREKNKNKNDKNEKKLIDKDDKQEKEAQKNNNKKEKNKKKISKKEKPIEASDEDEISEEHYGNNFQTKAEDLDFDAIVKGNRRVLRSHTRIFPVLKNIVPTETEKNEKNLK